MNRYLNPVLDAIHFEGHPNIGVRQGDGWIQLVDADLPAEFATGRKWRISDHMTRSEIAQTVLNAWLAWWEHEARESLRYNGVPVFGPHYDVDQLAKLAATKPWDVRS